MKKQELQCNGKSNIRKMDGSGGLSAYILDSWNKSQVQHHAISLQKLLSNFKEEYPNTDKVCVLITAERDFDSKGFQHVPCDYGVSTLLNPGGLPIEGGEKLGSFRPRPHRARTG
jgi:hypothetical protein